MKSFLKLVGGIAVGIIVLSVLYGILHALLSFAVAGAFLLVVGVVCLLAVVGLFALARGLIGRSLPSSKLPGRNTNPIKRVDKTADKTLRELERRLGPRQ